MITKKGCFTKDVQLDRLLHASYQLDCLKSWEAFPFCAFTTRVYLTVLRVFLGWRAIISEGPVVETALEWQVYRQTPLAAMTIGLFRETGQQKRFGQRPQTACKLLASKDDAPHSWTVGVYVSFRGRRGGLYLLVRGFEICLCYCLVGVWSTNSIAYMFGTLLMMLMAVQVFL